MPGGGKPKRIEDTTAKDIWLSLFFGSLIGGVILAASFFSKEQEWFTWFIRGFAAFWLIAWWRKHIVWRRQLINYKTKHANPEKFAAPPNTSSQKPMP